MSKRSKARRAELRREMRRAEMAEVIETEVVKKPRSKINLIASTISCMFGLGLVIWFFRI